MTELYDIKAKTVSYADGVPTESWAVKETTKIDCQPIRYNTGRGSAVLAIDVGGESYIPSFRAFIDLDSDITATDRITNNSGTTELLVLRTYDYEDHKEVDLREVSD